MRLLLCPLLAALCWVNIVVLVPARAPARPAVSPRRALPPAPTVERARPYRSIQ